MKSFKRKKYLVGIGLAGGVLLVLMVLLLLWPRPTEANDPSGYGSDDDPEPTEAVPVVPTIRPQRNLAFVIECQQPADVEPFYRADLQALVAGSVKRIPKGLNDHVSKGELLIEVDVPDRVQEVLEKGAVVQQRMREHDVACHKAQIAVSAIKAAEENIKQKEADVLVAEAERDYREEELKRFTGLARKGVITPDVVSEKKKFYLAGEAGVVSARAAERKAQADLEEMKARSLAAQADIKLKESQIEVAKQDVLRAQTLADYAKIRAPFEGTIIRRDVDPGDFVHNAATGQSQPLLSLVRTDIMTVVMKLPDTYAPYVTKDTDAIIQLPGRRIRAKVTRYPASIHQKDRTMRVEVDLYNESLESYHGFVLKGLSSFLPALGLARGPESAVLLAAGRHAWSDNMKTSVDSFPCFPERATDRKGKGRSTRLLPRMYGYMTLFLKDFPNEYLIPTQAIFSRGGKKYILVVKNKEAHRVPVFVEVHDARLAKVAILIHKIREGGDAEEHHDLTGDEEIIASGQTEIQEGQKVDPHPIPWPTPVDLAKQ